MTERGIPIATVAGSTSRQPPLRIVVDARAIRASGIGRYLREILVRLIPDERFARVTLLGNPRELGAYREEVGATASRIPIIDFDHPMYSVGAQLAWRRMRRSPDLAGNVFFFPHYDAPATAMPRRSVVTVHDLIHFKVPQAFPLRKRLAAGVLLRRVVDQAERVIAVSAATRQDLLERFPGAGAKIQVVHQGVSPFFRPGPDASGGEAAAVNDVLPRHFLLCVGNRKPHKNLRAAVETLARLRDDHPHLYLVVAGAEFEGWRDVVELAAERGVEDRLIIVEDAGDDGLRTLYRQCEALLFPSLYEGFGLPVVEAMACGAPVVASNRSSLPEIVGGAAILVEPDDHAGMAAAVTRLGADPELRGTMVARGLEQAARFSWEATARATIEVLLGNREISGNREQGTGNRGSAEARAAAGVGEG